MLHWVAPIKAWSPTNYTPKLQIQPICLQWINKLIPCVRKASISNQGLLRYATLKALWNPMGLVQTKPGKRTLSQAAQGLLWPTWLLFLNEWRTRIFSLEPSCKMKVRPCISSIQTPTWRLLSHLLCLPVRILTSCQLLTRVGERINKRILSSPSLSLTSKPPVSSKT